MKAEAPLVSVIVPNWNGVRHLPECLDHLEQQTLQDFELIVVDNASTDTSVQWLEANAPRARVVRRDINGGFSGCVNSGIRVAQGDYVAILMNDTAASPEWLESLVTAVDGTGYDFAASRLVFYDSPETINAAGDVYDMRLLAGRQRGRGDPVTDCLGSVRVLGACAGAALYRRDFFEDVGLFDEGFFMVHEDTDLNLRALIAGKRCVYAPDAVVRHKDSATIRVVPELQEYTIRNQYRVVSKDMPCALLPIAAALWVFHAFRTTIPLRPWKWHLIPTLVRQLNRELAFQAEGLRLGWRARADVWSRRVVSRREIVQWLMKGVGPR